MELHEALYTTRAMRRLRPDAVPEEVQRLIFDAAVRAPIGSNDPGKWLRFVAVTDPKERAALGALYNRVLSDLNRTTYEANQQALKERPDDPALEPAVRMDASARYLADHLYEVPLLVFAFGKPGGEASVFPALWSMCLAARAEGYGSVFTTLMKHVTDDVYRLLGVPADTDWQMMAMVPVGLPIGRWGLAPRQPAHEAVFANRWGEPVHWRVDEPMWTPPY